MFGGPEEGKASGVAFSITKAQAFFLYPTPPVPKSQRAEFLDFPFPAQSCFKAGMWDQLFYQKVQGGCSSSKVGMLVTLTGMEMMAHGSPCCSRERRIM